MTHPNRTAPDRVPAFALAAALAAAAAASPGCATLGASRAGESLVPSRFETPAGPFVVRTNTPVAADSAAVRCLGSLERDVAANLGVRAPEGSPPVEIYILRDRETFAHFLRFYYPELPPRRAFFLAQGDSSTVYTFQNDRLEEDLRHEATHALLHAAVGDLPLWLDEGLAEYLENPDGRPGFNAEHVARIPEDLKAGWRPDLARLEGLRSVREMTPRDYREAWAWVHYVLNGPGPGKAALLGYLADLRSSPDVPPLSARLAKIEPGQDARMLAHFDRVRANPPPLPRPDRTVLLQSPAAEPSAPPRPAEVPPRTRGFFGRIFGLFGGKE